MKLFFFDTETTGVDPHIDRIIQFGGIFGEFDPVSAEFRERESVNQYINIPGEIPIWASRVHGIYKKDLLAFGYMGQYLASFLNYLQKADFVIGHNIAFDANMLKAEAQRLGLNFNFNAIKWIDTMTTTTLLVNKPGKRRPKLQELYRFLFGKEFADAHNAMADIRATQACFCQLVKTTKIFDQLLWINEKKDKNQISDVVEPEVDNGLDLSPLKEKRSDNPQALQFLDLVEKGNESIFLSGKAWSGKSTLIRDLIATAKEQDKRPVVLWSTGISALNIWGQTVHSFFSLGIEHVYFRELIYYIQDPENKKFKLSREKIKLLKQAPFIIIDEISMLSSNIIDCINVLMTFYLKASKATFGNKQMIFVGDIYQLPPVKTQERITKFKDIYKSERFFDSFTFKKLNYSPIELIKNYRQKKDQILANILDNIRNSNHKAEDLLTLNQKAKQNLNSDAILLSTHRSKVDTTNAEKLAQLPGESFIFHAENWGIFPQNMKCVDDELLLKPWAKIMLTINDPKGRRVNGSIAHIIEINPSKETISIQLGSQEYIISKHTRINTQTTIWDDGKIQEEEIWFFRQFPLQLAYAITIHKSQGLTLQHCQIDLNDTFVGGQAYTALSRVASLEGLSIKGEIKAENLFFDEHIHRFIKILKEKTK